MVPGVVKVYIHHGGEFIENVDRVDYVAGDKDDIVMDYEWIFLGMDIDILGNACGYDKVVMCAVKKNDSPDFTILPNDYQAFQDIVEKAIDIRKNELHLYIKGVNEDELCDEIGINVVGEDGEIRNNVAGEGAGIGLYVAVEGGDNMIVDKGKDKACDYDKEDDSMNDSESGSDVVYSDHSDDDDEIMEARKTLRLRIASQTEIWDYDSDHSLDSIDLELGSDDEEVPTKKKKCTTSYFASNCDLKNIDWKLGMRFKDKKECKDAMVEWAILNGWNIRWTRSNDWRIKTECVKGCKWRFYASKLSDEPTFAIKVYIPEHNCVRMKRNRQANKMWTAKKLSGSLERNPKLTANFMIKDIEEKFDVMLTRQMCYRAKDLAFDHIRGSYVDDYKKLRSYVLELMRTDVEGKFLLKTALDEKDQPIFERIFIGFSSIKKAFQIGCRHIIGFYACFLKTAIGGAILAAVSKDCNYKMYPLAWAVVEKENEDTWSWFCEHLFEHFGIDNGLGWSFMSDKQKGLINAIQKLAPNAEHRNCARHVYANFKKKWSGEKYKELFSECVKVSTLSLFESKLENMRSENVEAWADFCSRNPKSFCKSLICTYTKSDMLDNNICESFNSFILDARDMPILHMLEDIRLKLMTRMRDIADTLDKCNDDICPNVRKRIYKLEKYTKNWSVKPAVGGKYEVHSLKLAFIVDLKNKTCNCRDWELSGVPCCHALACIHYARENVVNYVDQFHFKSTSIEMYKIGLSPIHGEQDWPTDTLSPIMPPIVHKLPGRPKKQRKRELDEVKLHNAYKVARSGLKIRCTNCGGLGHNKRSCKEMPKLPNQEGGTLSQVKKSNVAKKMRKEHLAPTTTSLVKQSDAAKKIIRKERTLAQKGLGLLQAESGNVFVKHSVTSRAHFVSGSRATAAIVARIRKSQTAKNSKGQSSSHFEDGGSQLLNPTPPS